MHNYFETQWMLFITQFLLIPAVILAMYAQTKVSSTFNKYAKVMNSRGFTGADVARKILIQNGITDVTVVQTRGKLTDHYDPRAKAVRLSESVYNSQSIAALAVAAHEVGHATQHNKGYIPLNLRSAFFPVTAISSKIAMPLILIGLYFSSTNGFMLQLGIILFSFTVLFQVITLPVEFNASKRALQNLSDYNFLNAEEVQPAKQVLSAAALTYVAAALSAALQLIRLILIANSRDRD